jgi:hypothetical protein
MALKTEVQHNTPEQVRGYLERAWQIMEELGPPDDLRVVMFTQAVNLLASKQVFIEQPQPTILGMTPARPRL